MELYHRRAGEELLEFSIELFDSGETDVWRIVMNDTGPGAVCLPSSVYFVETVREPDPGDLIEAILDVYYGDVEGLG